MGFLVKRLPYKNRAWKLQYQSYKGKRKIRDIKEEEYSRYGLTPQSTIEEAKAAAQHLNSQERLKREEELRHRVALDNAHKATIESAYLPKELKERFEREQLNQRFDWHDVVGNKQWSHWRATQKLIVAIGLDAPEWHYAPEIIYRYFIKNGISPSYCQKILRLLNIWGGWYCRKTGKAFLPVTAPTGEHKAKVVNAYTERRHDGMASLPIKPEELHEAKLKGLDEKHFNWIYISVWFGLRPAEIDRLRKPANYKIHYRFGKRFLSVFQEKLITLDTKKKWKHIPINLKEQELAIPIIENKDFKRPSVKIFRNYFKDGVYAYGGRKGFYALMTNKHGFKELHVSKWLGHASIERTLKDYVEGDEVFLG